MAHAGPGVSPRRKVAMFTTTTAQGKSSTATAEWRRQRNEVEASTTRSVGGFSSRPGSPTAWRSWRWRSAASHPTPSAKRKCPRWSSTMPDDAHHPRLGERTAAGRR
eukprot:12927783-Alexandrium_andersonii.AAC.1